MNILAAEYNGEGSGKSHQIHHPVHVENQQIYQGHACCKKGDKWNLPHDGEAVDKENDGKDPEKNEVALGRLSIQRILRFW